VLRIGRWIESDSDAVVELAKECCCGSWLGSGVSKVELCGLDFVLLDLLMNIKDGY
jgi:hypothetical protein